MIRIRVVAAACLLPLLVPGCVTQHIAQGELKSALVDAGLPAQIARCMAHRMVDQLTIRQLRKLQALKGLKRTVADYLAAVQRVNDPQVIRVAIGAAGLCATGWER